MGVEGRTRVIAQPWTAAWGTRSSAMPAEPTRAGRPTSLISLVQRRWYARSEVPGQGGTCQERRRSCCIG